MAQITSNKICIAGKNEIAVYGLEQFVNKLGSDSVIAVVNNTDDGYNTWQPSLRKRAAELGVSVVSLDDCYHMHNLIFISLEFDRLIKPCNFTTKKLYNIHFSALPAYKGMYTSALPLLNGENKSGVTLHRIDRGIDTGEIIEQLIFPIDSIKSARELYYTYLKHSKELLDKCINKLITGNFSSIQQSSVGSSYYSKSAIDYSTLNLNLMQTAYQISNQIKAFTFAEYQVPNIGNYFVNHASITSEPSKAKAGTILNISETTLRIATIDYDLLLLRDKTTELMVAAEKDNLTLARECVENCAVINWRNGRGWSPLIVASYYGSIDVLNLLIERGADINLSNYKGTTPIMYAMSHYEKTGNTEPFYRLIDAGVDMHLRDLKGKSVRDYAIERGVTGLDFFI